MNPDFPLASWEVPPDAGVPLVAPTDFVFDGFWRGEETQILIREIEYFGGLLTFCRNAASDKSATG